MEDKKNPQNEGTTNQTPDNGVNNPSAAAVPAGATYYSPYIPRDKTPEYQAFKARVISPKGVIISVLSILLAILFTETILLGAAGISVPVFALAFYSSLFYFFKESGKPFNKPAIYLTFPVFLLAFSFFLHYNPSTQFITWLTLISLVCIQLVMLGNSPGEKLFSFDMLLKVLVNVICRPFTNLAMPFISLEYLRGRKSKTSKNAILIFIGLAVSLPVALILLGLFMSADAVFENAVNNLINYVGVDFGNAFADILVGFFGGILLSAALLGLKYEDIRNRPAGTVGNCLDSLIVGTFLTIINILLIAFVGFQFAYLFGGTSNITLTNMTYAEYARRGFFELTAASGLIFSIALFVMVMTRKKGTQLPLWVKLCTVSLCLCNGVLLVSGMKRMLLYVDVYGLSAKRVLTLWFMCIIGLCLVWLLLKSFIPGVDAIKLIGITVVAGVCILSLTNTERLIARYNIDRYISSPNKITLDVYHLGRLSYTAAPEIARLRTIESKDGQYTRRDIADILYKQEQAYYNRNRLYGFTLDSIRAQEIFSGK